MTTVEKAKLAQTPAREVFFQYRPYRKGARKAPASAPQDTPISCAMKVTLDLYWMMASTTEMAMNTTIRPFIQRTCFFSSISLTTVPLRKSSVRVELEASTREDRVDMEADSTRMTTTAIKRAGRPDSMVGMTESKPLAAMSILSENSLPKPPRK